MVNYFGSGDPLTIPAPSGTVSGEPKLVGSLLVVPQATATEGDMVAVKTTGEFTVTKVGSQAWTVGAKVYWDNGNTRFTTSSGGNTLVGVATEVVGAGAGETTGKVRLDGVAR